MSASSSLSADVVAAIDDLELAARIVAEGLRTGGHRSPFHGFTTEFSQHRSYRAGDDLKYLDWKLFARSDRLYTRQFRETTNLSVLFALDTSASMDYPAGGVTKFRYAQILIAALAYLAAEQGHAVGLMTSEGERLSYVAPRGGRVHLRSLLARIDRLVPAGRWDGPRAIERGARLLERRGVVLVASDFYDDEEATRRVLRHVAQRGHDVAMLHLLSADELALPFSDHVELEDAESGARRLVDASAVRATYAVAVNEFLERCRSSAARDGVDYALLRTDLPPASALREYLIRRAARPNLRAPARAVAK
jgi:uncharacterized protein (DUF58 family)